MPALPPPSRPGVLRPWGAAATALLLGVGLATVPAAPAAADLPVCGTTTPALNAEIACTIADTDQITVPSGATAVRLKVTGGGGGGSRAAHTWYGGGKGATVYGWATLPTGTDYLVVDVGEGGAAGVAGANSSLGGGGGGGGTGVFAYDNVTGLLGALVIAGGGGGAGGKDTSAEPTGAGGNAGSAGAGFVGGGYDAPAGAAGLTNGTGGAGGDGEVSGSAGGNAVAGTVAAGGAGAMIDTQRGGGGGGGYTGGGGGAAQDPVEAGGVQIFTGSPDFLGGGGGGGSTFIATSAMLARKTGVAGSTGAGAGGTGLAASDAAVLADGGAGAVEMKFAASIPSPEITSVSPIGGPTAGGGTLTITGTDLEGTMTVMMSAMLCNPVVVVSPTELTCTIPMNVLGGTVPVMVLSPNGTDALSNAYTYGPAPTITSVSPTSGSVAGGGTLTINGTNLTGTSSITVAGFECASVVNVSISQVTCTIPEALETGTVGVALTAATGSATAAAAYTYVEVPEVTSVSPVTGLLAGGGTLTINGTLLSGTSAVSLGGAACDSINNVSATEVTCTVPARVSTGLVDLSLTATAGTGTLASAYTYTYPAPSITSVSPASGRLSGGGTLTITGTNLLLTSSVMFDETPCTGIVNVSETQVTCTIPAGTVLGPVSVNLTALGGFDGEAAAYTYVITPPPPPPPLTTPPTTPPTTEPTPEPTPTETPAPTPTQTPAPTPTETPAPTTPPTPAPPPTETPAPTPTERPRLQLTLDLEVNSPVVGAQAVMTGGGLLSKSTYVLTMRSTPVQVATGVTDDAGNFEAQIRLPSKVCVSGGLHELVLTGITPDGEALRDSSWIVLDDNCKTRSVRKAKPVNNTVTLGSFIFPYLSAKLTPHSKSVLRGMRSPLRTAKRVTITGYTQTTKKSKAAKRFNRVLAKRRAVAVRAYLRSVGIRAPIVVLGAGGVKPLKGRTQKYNRRVVITVRY